MASQKRETRSWFPRRPEPRGWSLGKLRKSKAAARSVSQDAEKCAYIVKELGFDAAIDYKSEDVRKALQTHCPKGIDIYFDNVGGEILDFALSQLARGARVAICGAISQYNNTTPIKGPSNYLSLLINRASMKGFLVFDYADRYAEAGREMAGWMAAGKLKSRDDFVEGIRKLSRGIAEIIQGREYRQVDAKGSRRISEKICGEHA